MKPSEALNAAADHLNRVGLNKGQLYDTWREDEIKRVPCCMSGALRIAQPDFEARAHTRSFLEPLIPGHSIPEWNDAPERTKEEVIAKLREAAELARAEGN